MTFAVTGGTGFVGTHVVRVLLERGHQVRVACRATSPTLALQGLTVERVVVDLTSVEDCTRFLDGCEGLYHVAGTFDSQPGGRERMHKVHVTATRSLCEAALKAGCPKVVLCSSSITLPYGTLDAPAAETDPDPNLGKIIYKGPLQAYRETKLEEEAIGVEYSARGLHVVTVNPDYIVGSWDLKPTSGQLILQIAKVPWVPFYPPGGKTFIDARDCALGHVLAMEKGTSGQRYLLGNENLTYHEFMKTVARVVGRPPPLIPLPMLLGTAIGRIGERLGPRLPPEIASVGEGLVESMFKGRYRSPERARTELGLPQTPIHRAVESAWRWFKDHGYAS